MRASKIPAVTADQMREVDRLMVEKYGIQMVQMMENAGANLARLVRQMLKSAVLGKRVIVAAGKGGNGGGGLVAARHLSNWGARATVLVESGKVPAGVSGLQFRALRHLPVETRTGDDALRWASHARADIVVDALIGYSLSGNPRGWASRMIRALNKRALPVVALDLPSGMDATTGALREPCIRATATLTLALPKTGLLRPGARGVVGSLYLADIGVPPALYRKMGLSVPSLFSRDTLIPLQKRALRGRRGGSNPPPGKECPVSPLPQPPRWPSRSTGFRTRGRTSGPSPCRTGSRRRSSDTPLRWAAPPASTSPVSTGRAPRS